MTIEPRVGLVDPDVIAQHHKVDHPVQSGIGQFAVLDVGEAVGEYTYIIIACAQVREEVGSAVDECRLLREACEVERVEPPREVFKLCFRSVPIWA